MAEKLQIYKCMACGNIVEVLHGGEGELVCCGQPMENIVAKTADEGKEKHVPVIEKIEGGYKVKIGTVSHPATASAAFLVDALRPKIKCLADITHSDRIFDCSDTAWQSIF